MSDHLVTAGAPAGTAEGSGEPVTIPIPRPRPERLDVRTVTAFNWMEAVYAAFGYEFPSEANQAGFLGVREAEGESGNEGGEDFTRTERPDDSHKNASNIWDVDDMLFLGKVGPEGAETEQTVEGFDVTIDPHVNQNADGWPYLLEGKLYKTQPKTDTSKKEGLLVYSGSAGSILLAREATSDHRTFEDLASARVDGGNFVRVESNYTILIHGSSPGNGYVESAGCTILSSKRPKAVGGTAGARWRRLKSLADSAANRREIPYLVVSSDYILSYSEWREKVLATTGKVPKDLVLRKEQLRAAPNLPGSYLPSIMTEQFAKDVWNEGGLYRISYGRSVFQLVDETAQGYLDRQ